MMVLKVLIV